MDNDQIERTNLSSIRELWRPFSSAVICRNRFRVDEGKTAFGGDAIANVVIRRTELEEEEEEEEDDDDDGNIAGRTDI